MFENVRKCARMCKNVQNAQIFPQPPSRTQAAAAAAAAAAAPRCQFTIVRGEKKATMKNKSKEIKMKWKWNWNEINTDAGGAAGAPAASAATTAETTVKTGIKTGAAAEATAAGAPAAAPASVLISFHFHFYFISISMDLFSTLAFFPPARYICLLLPPWVNSKYSANGDFGRSALTQWPENIEIWVQVR